MHNPVPHFQQSLRALSGLLAKAEAHCEAGRIDPAALLGFRLFPDMFPFTRQVQVACDHAKGAPLRLAGREVPSFEDTEASFAELRDRVGRTAALIGALRDADFVGAEGRTIHLKLRSRELALPAPDYLHGFAVPNFFFHATTAYNILRHNGVPVGKADFIGA